jgi:murein DD-endopeptidase MepM/ murein hydrolase activator NlpD
MRPSEAADLVQPRLVVGGGVLSPAEESVDAPIARVPLANDPEVLQRALAAELGFEVQAPEGEYLADGTLLKPVAVDTSIPDVRERLTTYRVKPGDTLTGIANKYDVSMMTIWWANKLSAKDDLKIGQQLVIPPTDGLVVTVAPGDTLAKIAERARVAPTDIQAYNGLADETVVVGQVLMVPGALGAAIATPTPKPAAKAVTSGGSRSTSSGGSGPVRYTGGRFGWPTGGGYVSQYYHYGHYAIDIAGPYGTRIKAAAAGKVIFAGWKNNGGGYQVHISHGSGLYTAYYHMSSISVGRGASVSRGSAIGGMGRTGWATGNHLHFEVWIGGIWNGGRRVNPLAYL